MTVIDLSLPISNQMPGVDIAPARQLEVDGWNATTLRLYSHCGTHLDAPRHFLPEGPTIEHQDLDVCIGPALVVDLTPVAPGQRITVEDLAPYAARITAGSRVLVRTDWYQRFGTAEYRDQLPRISLELAEWLVDRKVCLLGVEPPSVADVNNPVELTAVHRTLFAGKVLIVEGLANLDRLTSDVVQFIALPLHVVGGDGTPIRAVAVEI